MESLKTYVTARARLVVAGMLAAATATAALAATSARAEDRPVKMLLDWIYNGPNSGFMVAKEKGFYKAAGLDVSIEQGKGSGSTAQLIASGVAQFGFSDGFVVGTGISKGMNIKMVAGVFRRNPTAVIVLKESGITSPKQLEGKTIGIATGAAQFQQWPAYVRGCKLDASQINVVNIDPAGYAAALLAGKVSGVAGFAQGMVPSIETRAQKETTILWYADCGVSAVSNGIIVNNDLIKSDPALIKDFVKASLQGFLYGRAHPDEAVEIIKKYQPNAVPALSKREMAISWENWVTPDTKGKPLGWMSEKDWAATIDVLKKYGGVTGELTTEMVYTDKFLPSGAEFVPPQQ